MANFLFKCERCERTETLPAMSVKRRFCSECYQQRHTQKRRELRKRERDALNERRTELGMAPIPLKPTKKASACDVCSGVPDRRPLEGCRCGHPYLVEGRDGRWRPPQAEKVG